MADEPLKLIDARRKMFRVVLDLAADEMGGALKYVSYSDMIDAARELVAAEDAWTAEMKRRRREHGFMTVGSSMNHDG